MAVLITYEHKTKQKLKAYVNWRKETIYFFVESYAFEINTLFDATSPRHQVRKKTASLALNILN
jgi:hypothetical protein